jgi:cytochrome c2
MKRRRLLILGCVAIAGGCQAQPPPASGDAERGRLLLRQFPCRHCHTIPGVANARGKVGPPLDRLSQRVYLAGTLPNTRDNLVRWILAPQDVKPGSAMPDLGVTELHARDMAAYLYTLE